MRYVGMDVGKRETTWCAIDGEGRRTGRSRIPTDPQVAAELVSTLGNDGDPVAVALESGNVTFRLARAMQERGADVVVVHPRDNALIAKSWRKSDGIDARTLARQRRLQILPRHGVHVPSQACEDLRHLVTAREALVDRCTAVTSQMLHVVARYGIFPAKRIFKADRAWVDLRPRLRELDAADRLIVRQHIHQARQIIAQRRRLEAELRARIARDFAHESELLRSIPGVGEITTASVIAWGTPMTRFETARHFASYVGLAPTTRQSGEKRVDGGTARTGNRHLGRNLVQAALSFSCHTDDGHELWCWYDHVARKRGWRKARVALARKISAVCYGVLTHQTPYDPAHIARTLRKEEPTT